MRNLQTLLTLRFIFLGFHHEDREVLEKRHEDDCNVLVFLVRLVVEKLLETWIPACAGMTGRGWGAW